MEVLKKETLKQSLGDNKENVAVKEDHRKKIKLPKEEEIKQVKLKSIEKDVVNKVFKMLWDLGKL
jgi:hypothetical protein